MVDSLTLEENQDNKDQVEGPSEVSATAAVDQEEKVEIVQDEVVQEV